MINHKFYLLFLLIPFLLVGCATTQVNHTQPLTLHSSPRIGVLPFVNQTETPQADARVASITSGLLRTRGANVVSYPSETIKPTLIPGLVPPPPISQTLRWANTISAQYALTGTVSEYRYKVGLDGEPVVGITLQLLKLPSGQIVWSSVGSASGYSRQALASATQVLILSMLSSLNFK